MVRIQVSQQCKKLTSQTTTPRSSTPIKIEPPPVSIITEINIPTAPITPSSNNFTLAIAIGAVALGILGFFGLKFKKKKKQDEEKGDSNCLNFKKLMEDKLNELTDLKGQLIKLTKDQTVEQIKNTLAETTAGKLLVSVEEKKKQFEKLKELYEKCMLDFSIPKTTLLFLYKPKEKQILLGMKKRRFGAGKWNGVGGKLLEGENLTEALIREVFEEIKVKINSSDLIQVATLDFTFKDNKKWNQQTHVFITEKLQGEPTETEEMNPTWYDIDKIPYENMWIDDIHWLPLVLEGKKINASFNFNKTGDKILEMKIEEII